MSTRATYQFAHKDLPTLTFYIHHDGYPEGAAHYFWLMHHCKRKGVTLAEKFLVANDRVELTRGHDYHGDTDYRYTLTGDYLVAAMGDTGDVWKNFFVGDWWEFVNKYGEEFCGGDRFQPLRKISDSTVFSNGAQVVYTRSELLEAIESREKNLAAYREKFPTYTGNIAGMRAGVERAKANLAAYDAVDSNNVK